MDILEDRLELDDTVAEMKIAEVIRDSSKAIAAITKFKPKSCPFLLPEEGKNFEGSNICDHSHILQNSLLQSGDRGAAFAINPAGRPVRVQRTASQSTLTYSPGMVVPLLSTMAEGLCSVPESNWDPIIKAWDKEETVALHTKRVGEKETVLQTVMRGLAVNCARGLLACSPMEWPPRVTRTGGSSAASSAADLETFRRLAARLVNILVHVGLDNDQRRWLDYARRLGIVVSGSAGIDWQKLSPDTPAQAKSAFEAGFDRILVGFNFVWDYTRRAAVPIVHATLHRKGFMLSVCEKNDHALAFFGGRRWTTFPSELSPRHCGLAHAHLSDFAQWLREASSKAWWASFTPGIDVAYAFRAPTTEELFSSIAEWQQRPPPVINLALLQNAFRPSEAGSDSFDGLVELPTGHKLVGVKDCTESGVDSARLVELTISTGATEYVRNIAVFVDKSERKVCVTLYKP